MDIYKGYYFKNQSPDRPLMSGCQLPKDNDGIVRNKTFKECSFHPNCQDVQFINCTFEFCNGDEYIK